MQLSLNNFLYGLKQIVMGDTEVDGGVLVDRPIDIAAVELSSNVALAADETNGRVIKVTATNNSVFHITQPVPRDYDEALDTLKVRVLASQATVSTDDDVELDSELYVKVPGESLSSDKDPTAPGTVLSTTEQWIEFDLSGNELTRDDVFIFELITNGANDTANEEVLIHAIELMYRSTVVSYDEFDSDENSLR